MHHNNGAQKKRGKEKNPQIVLGMNRECNVKDEKWKKKRINIGKRKPYIKKPYGANPNFYLLFSSFYGDIHTHASPHNKCVLFFDNTATVLYTIIMP